VPLPPRAVILYARPRMLKQSPPKSSAIDQPSVIPRSEHEISRASISAGALKVLQRLHNSGFEAYLVGGGVRDLLMGREPKDFDIATEARPEQLRALFRNCRLIGRRFRLAHIHFANDVVEVATFRATRDDGEGQRRVEDGRIIRDNVYGNIEEDAWRRDFTINALYYSIVDHSVRDYVGGIEDVRAGVLRLIGEPMQRYREDPVRLLRAVRFLAKLGLKIDPGTEAALFEQRDLLDDIAPARLFDETQKLFLTGHAVRSLELLEHYGLLGKLFTDTVRAFEQRPEDRKLLLDALANTDERVSQGKPVTPAFLFAAMLWAPFQTKKQEFLEDGMRESHAIHLAAEWVTARQVLHTALPRRFSAPMREIWGLQPRFHLRQGRRPLGLLSRPRFRAAYDFLLLRARQDADLLELAEWWTDIQDVTPDEQKRLVMPRGRRRQRPRKRRPGGQPDGNNG
jgi:poly(A) polymerase